MQLPTATPYPVSDFLEWEGGKQLVIAPKFQRRDIWVPKAKSYLVDTMLRGMPIPPLFIRLKVDPLQKRTIREVVDGQQRLRAVFSYIRGEFPIMKVHNPDYAGKYYLELPEDVQMAILGYKFSVYNLQDVSDAEVLAIFARMNTYTVKLNAQELRNAEFFGAFKQTMYEIGFKHYAFWKNNGVLADSQIARMSEAELVSELVISILSGLRQTKEKDLRKFYFDYDDEFEQSETIVTRFEIVISTMVALFGDYLKVSPFRRMPLFYTMFCLLYDTLFGLPGSSKGRITYSSARNKLILESLKEVGKLIESGEGESGEEKAFLNVTKRATADVGSRKTRHEFIWKKVFQKFAEPVPTAG